MRRGWLSLILVGLSIGPAGASVPPIPPDDALVIAASCGTTRTVMPFDQVPAAVTPLASATLPVEGHLRWRWGLRIATGDARVATVSGMEFSGAYGLLAVTRGGIWLSFDLQGGTLADMRSVGVAAMKGAAGSPTSVVTPYGDRTYVAFGGTHPVVARYALGACGSASAAVPWIDVTGAAEPLVVQGAYTYLGVVGRRAGEGSALVLAYERKRVTLAGISALGAPGRTLVAASNPARIAPEIVVARRDAHGRTDLAFVSVNAWSDIHGGPPRPETPLAILSRTPGAMASYYSAKDKTTLVILAYPGPRAGTLDLYALDTDAAL